MPELLARAAPVVGATNPPKGREPGQESDDQRRNRLRGGDPDFLRAGNLVMYKTE
jgi:hypothetical protein